MDDEVIEEYGGDKSTGNVMITIWRCLHKGKHLSMGVVIGDEKVRISDITLRQGDEPYIRSISEVVKFLDDNDYSYYSFFVKSVPIGVNLNDGFAKVM